MKNSYLTPESSRELSPKEFLKLSQQQSSNIKSTRFVPPVFGKKGFGHFHVEFTSPVLVAHGR